MNINAEFVEAVEDEVGMGAGAWDCVRAEDICRAVLKIVARAVPAPQALDSQTPELELCDHCVRCGKDKYTHRPPYVTHEFVVGHHRLEKFCGFCGKSEESCQKK